MTENIVRTIHRGGCRLCMAPDTECVPIFATAAADKEPLASKIQACVNIKIHPLDRLSGRVCHACISYLNSWQSFKNRCYAAQKKQRGMMEMWQAKERARMKNASQLQSPPQLQSQPQLLAATTQRQIEMYKSQLEQQRILKDVLSQPSGSISYKYSQEKYSNVDVTFIKSEPADDIQNDAEGVDDDDEMDPSQFLARENDEDTANDEEGGGPPILTSLGLTHINHVNPYCFVSTELGNEYPSETDTSNNMYPSTQTTPRATGAPPCCSICSMKFSNRANARRHERNIHGIQAEPTTSTPTSSLSSMSSIMRPITIMRRPVVPAVQKKKKLIPPIVYDYTKPELYRENLTESKLYFIKRHIDFLEQYQNMKCTCCDREFLTYKTFMVHMRKRYDTLSRNLCFKCLKQFQSKALFVAHLKKKNCLNLYKVYCADDTVSKEPLPPIQARVGTKEIIANKVYGCKLCAKTFRLKMDFRGHVYEAHGDVQKKESLGADCGYCKTVFADSNHRRRHYNNMECIVFINCGTCAVKLDTLPQYVEHVYAEHLKPQLDGTIAAIPNDSLISPEASVNLNSSNDQDSTSPTVPANYASLKYPQNCKVCGKQYNNYYNVLRHMESKHPNQLPDTYRCEPCDIGYPRQTELREHMYKSHGVTMPKIKRESFTCRICLTTFDNKEVWIEHQATNHSTFYCTHCDMETESKEELEAHLDAHTKQSMFTCTMCGHSFQTERGLETHLAVMHQMKKEDMAPSNGRIEEGVDIDGEFNLNEDDDEEGALEISADVHVNGETGGDFENGNEDEDDDEDQVNETYSDEGEHKRLRLENAVPKGEIANLLTCPLCNETFAGKIALSNHMRIHGAISPSPCYTNQPKVGTVKRAGLVSNRMRCRLCQKRIHTKIGYKRHMLVVHQVRDCVFIKCKICPAEFSNDKGLKVHMFRTHNVTVQQMQNDERLRPTPKQESTTGSNLPKILPKIAPKLMFECNICHTVYRNHEQLSSHRSVVHGTATPMTSNNSTENLDTEDIVEPFLPIPEAWWQCRYCDDTFNASKKLTIHMNSHEEHDNTDNSCKDCGNVYGTRKSLWVHRHKKHPRVYTPSNCVICNRVFFDKTELYYHLKTHSNEDVYSNLMLMHKELENDPAVNLEKAQSSNFGAVEEDLKCHICGQTYHDKRVLSKHLRVHELENNPLHTLLDIDDENGSSDYSYPSYQGQMVDGQFACDMCPKRFSLMNALKVHRGWHFRSPDGRQVTDPANMWQPDSIPQSKFKRTKAVNPPTCPFCNSTFASGNNLRRHIVEVHKRNEAKLMRENGTVSETVFVEKELECQTCSITFSSRPEWVDHKISHARTMKPSTTFEWGCEICGKVFTRKERLLAHMVTHLSGKDEGSVNSADQSEVGENSRSSMSSQSHSQQSQESSSLHQRMQHQQLMKQQHPLAISQNIIKPTQDNSEPDDDDEDVEDEIEDEVEEEQPQTMPEAAAYSCDLCQVFFRTAKELRRHVTSHIINGPETSQSADSDRNQQTTLLDGFKCRLCGSSSASHIGMIQCMESHKTPTNLRCGQCQLYFNDEQQVLDHETLCHPQSFN